MSLTHPPFVYFTCCQSISLPFTNVLLLPYKKNLVHLVIHNHTLSIVFTLNYHMGCCAI